MRTPASVALEAEIGLLLLPRASAARMTVARRGPAVPVFSGMTVRMALVVGLIPGGIADHRLAEVAAGTAATVARRVSSMPVFSGMTVRMALAVGLIARGIADHRLAEVAAGTAATVKATPVVAVCCRE